ncbi:MAG: SDR family oxidoreductase [Bdellovibrionales bacterium]|nr:SDR family oxidoreductase [Bdellovibrionales bacterium]
MDRRHATALITGASSGIGRELARVFAENHHSLILVARDRARLDAVAAELHQRFLVPVRVEVCDLADRAALEALISRLDAEHAVIDVLVNNAGVGIEGPFAEIDWPREREMLDVNVSALVRLTKAFLPQMVNRRSGRILQVASTAAFQPGPYLSLYFATKAFVLSFSEGLSAELRGSGVTVTTLCPGPTHTEFERRLGTDSGLFDTGLPVANAAPVAAYGYAALMKGKRVAVHGTVNRVLSFFSRILPNGIVLFFLGWAIGRKVVRGDLGSAKSKDFPAT